MFLPSPPPTPSLLRSLLPSRALSLLTPQWSLPYSLLSLPSLQRRVENRRQLIISEFEELHQFLEEEQQVLLRHLEEEEKEILQKLKDNVAQLSDQRLSLNRLITEIEEKCLQSGIEMLKVRLDATEDHILFHNP